MTRIVKILVLWFAVATVGCITAQAQNCGDWLKVTAWTGTYTLTSPGRRPLQRYVYVLPASSTQVTQILARWSDGDKVARPMGN
jgi:hypothetical protein